MKLLCKTLLLNIANVGMHSERLGALSENFLEEENNLIKLTQHVGEAFQCSELIGLVRLDEEKVFGVLWRLGLKPHFNDLTISFTKWMNSFLSQKKSILEENFYW